MNLFKPLVFTLFIGTFLSFPACTPIDYMVHRTNHKYNSMAPPQEDTDFHNSLFIADMHADSLLLSRDLNDHSCIGHVDFPRLKLANMGVQVFTIVSEYKFLGHDALFWLYGQTAPIERTIQQAENLADFVNKDKSVSLLKNKKDLNEFLTNNFSSETGSYHRLSDSQNLSVILGVEGAHMLDAEYLERDFTTILDLNVRLIGLAHSFDNQFAGSSTGKDKGGLTQAGEQLLQLMVDNGVILDLAHASSNTIKDVIKINKEKEWGKPLLVSHTGIYGHKSKERNISDEDAVAVARTGGVIGIMYWDPAVRKCDKNGRLDINSAVDAIIYLRDLLTDEGIANPYDHIGLGSDYDGFISAPFAVDKLNILTSTLLERKKIPKYEIPKIMGENVLRVVSAWLIDGQ